MHRRFSFFVPAIAAALMLFVVLGGCASMSGKAESPAGARPTATMKVSVTYPERMLLPPGCALFVELENLSRLDPKDKVVADAFLPVKAAPPFRIVLGYDPSRIVGTLRYAVSARIEFKGQVLFAGNVRLDSPPWPKDKAVEVTVRQVKP